MPDIVKETENFIRKYELLSPGQRVLVAVSGGQDSMVLWNVLLELGYQVALVHCNFQLRGDDSDEDERFVVRQGKEKRVPVFHRRFDTLEHIQASGKSLQMTARSLRYQYFHEVMETQGYPVCATAHHQEDQVETVIMSLLRGSGFRLVRGIPVSRPGFCRPLLGTSRASIEAWALEKGILHREDRSNADTKYLRNKVRHQVMPALEEIHPSASSRLLDFLDRYEEQAGLLGRFLKDRHQEAFLFDKDRLEIYRTALEPSPPMNEVRELVRVLLDDFQVPGSEFDQIFPLLEARPGKIFEGKYHYAASKRNGLEVRRNDLLPDPEWEVEIESLSALLSLSEISAAGVKVRSTVEDWEGGKVPALNNTFLLDVDCIVFPARLRAWRQGDRMQPMGMSGTKKLSDIFVNEKWSGFDKMEAVVFEDAQQILCLSGFRVAEKVKVSPQTRRILKISFSR